jgi:hypothetical protein
LANVGCSASLPEWVGPILIMIGLSNCPGAPQYTTDLVLPPPRPVRRARDIERSPVREPSVTYALRTRTAPRVPGRGAARRCEALETTKETYAFSVF